MWATDWRKLNKDAAPLMQSASSPGVCNVGGSRNDCYEVGVRQIHDLQRLRRDLQKVTVPTAYAAANRKIQDAVAMSIQAWKLRCQAIAQDDNGAWQQANVLFSKAHVAFSEAYREFPASRPLPVPIS
jgi:hypothetical protein